MIICICKFKSIHINTEFEPLTLHTSIKDNTSSSWMKNTQCHLPKFGSISYEMMTHANLISCFFSHILQQIQIQYHKEKDDRMKTIGENNLQPIDSQSQKDNKVDAYRYRNGQTKTRRFDAHQIRDMRYCKISPFMHTYFLYFI